MKLSSQFLIEAKERGFINQCTNIEKLYDVFNENDDFVTCYLGFDATAKSLHVGNLVGIMFLRLLKRFGHDPMVLLGDATTRIGDPSGKTELRKMLSEEEINNNIENFEKFFYKFLGKNTKIVKNNDWLSKLNYIDFLRDYGKYFSVNRMLSFESVKLRLQREQSITFLEFNYMIFQAYDFLHLYKTKDCILQVGGSDQWGNIVSGVELIHKHLGREALGLTFPLITNASGEKMGKSVKGAVWLDEGMLSAYDYWQFWRNTDDRDVIKYLKIFTELPIHEIEQYSDISGKEINDIKIILADEATKLVHGEECLSEIHNIISKLFNNKGENIGENNEHLPSFLINKEDLPMDWKEIFLNAGLVNSKSEFKRLVKENGIRINKEVLVDEFSQTKDLGEETQLSVGKKKHVILKLV